MSVALLAKDPEIVATIERAKTDFPFFARKYLKIRTKSGGVTPFVLNRAQMHFHEVLQDQERKTGKVRAIVGKGRQVGISTYIQGRYYWKLWKGRGLRAFILTHEQPATDNLFGMAQHFHDHMPAPLRPPTKAANAKELAFADNGCSYAVATAGTKGVGRSGTFQLIHSSEAAFQPNAETHIDGLFQALSDAPGTESIIESTGNGIGNVFQRRYVAAERGDGDEIAVFIPWFWDEGYQRECPTDFEPPPKWADYATAHGLTWEQLYWAYIRNRDMATAIAESPLEPCSKFKQEYPATAAEMFQTSGNSFIPTGLITKARGASVIGIGPRIIGVDPARGGGDRTGVVDRCGRRIGEHLKERWDDSDLMVLAGKIVNLIRLYKPDAVNIDVGGLGAGVYDRLAELGYGHIVNPVNFGSSPLGIGPTGDELYANRRSEMWDVMRDWFTHPAGVQIPDDDVLHADLASPVWGSGATRHSSSNELILEPKDKIRERLGFSPDLGDAAALTFAVPVLEAQPLPDPQPRKRNSRTGY